MDRDASPATKAFVVEPDPTHEAPWRVIAGGDQTGGQLVVGEAKLPPRTAGPSLHVHQREDEATFVIEGTLTFVIGDERLEAGPGSLVWAPRGIPHTFANMTDEPVRVVGMIVPSGLEGMFAEQGAYFASLQGPPDPAEIDAIGSKYGVKVVGPGLDPHGR